jgi:hypothetical protein
MKIRNYHKTPKDFGYSNEKYAKGCGRNGYARSYGVNKNGNWSKNRTLTELKNVVNNNTTIEMLTEYNSKKE